MMRAGGGSVGIEYHKKLFQKKKKKKLKKYEKTLKKYLTSLFLYAILKEP